MLPNRIFTRVSARTATVVLVMSLPSHAFANSASTLVDRWMADFTSMGASVASYERAEDGATENDVTIHGVKVEFDIPLPGGKDKVGVKFGIDAVTFEGLKETDKGYEAAKIAVPGKATTEIVVPGKFFDAASHQQTKLEIPDAPQEDQADAPAEGEAQAEAAPDAPATDEKAAEVPAAPVPDEPVKIVVTTAGYEAEGLAWNRLPTIPEDPQHPVTRYFEAVRTLLDGKGDRYHVETMTLEMTGPAGMNQKTVYEDYTMTGYKDFRIDEYSVGKTVQTQDFMPIEPDGDMSQISMTIGKQVVEDIDFMPILTLMGQGSDPSRMTIMGNQSIEDITVNIDKVDVKIGSATAGAIGITKAEKLAVWPYVDQAVLDENSVNEDEAAKASLDIVRVFKADGMAINGVSFTGPQVTGGLEKFEIKDVSSQGLGLFAFDGFKLDTDQGPQSVTINLDRFAFADIDFPVMDALIRTTQLESNGVEPSIQDMIDARPIFGLVEVANFSVKAAALGDGPIELETYRQSETNHINRIPTEAGLVIKGLRFPVSMVPDPQFQDLATRLNISEVVIDQNFEMNWDEATGDLTLKDLSLEMKDGGKIHMTFTIGGIPKSVFENPAMAQAALATANIKSGRIEAENLAVLSAFIGSQADQSGLSQEELAAGLVDTMAQDMGPLTGTRFGEELLEAASTFAADPKNLVIEIAPDAPVPVTQLLGAGATAPQTLPDLLGATATAE